MIQGRALQALCKLDPNKDHAMTAHERITAVLNRDPVDRLPVDIWVTPEIGDALKEHFGVEDDLDLFKALGVDKIVWTWPGYVGGPNEDGQPSGTHFGGKRSMWGTPLRDMNTGTALYQEFGAPPLADYGTPASLGEYPYWPDPARFDYAAATALAKRSREEYGFATNGPWVSFFEVYCQMRGMEQSMMDVLVDPDYVNAVLDKIEWAQSEMMKRFFDEAAAYVDMAFISDDMGSQEGLFIALDMWDRYFRDRMIRWCELIHSYGDIKVFYHSDGAVARLIPRLIDCGIDILNPIQHACPGMELAPLKERYGDRVIFHGGIENQNVLPFGSVDEVRAETRNCLETLGAGQEGYICCSCHNVQAGTPIENVLAMVETVRESAG